MNFNELQIEVLQRILYFLPPSDRLDSALTCRVWARALHAPTMMRDVWLVITGNQMDEAETSLSKSRRQYENLRISGVGLLKFNAAFWKRVGPTLLRLKLIGCTWSSEVYYAILRTCSNLKSLELQDVRRLPLSYFALPPEIDLRKVQESMRNLKHLHLDFYVSTNLLERILIAMPNVSSIALSRLDLTSDLLRRLPSILGTSRKITMLELYGYGVNADEQLLRISSAGLRRVRILDDRFARAAYEALRDCEALQQLSMPLNTLIDDHLLQHILRSVPELETLELIEAATGHRLTSDALMPILKLEQLRELDLSDLIIRPNACVSIEFLRNLPGMLSLETLKLDGGVSTIDDTSLRSLASLPNLRNLEIICECSDVKWLRIVFLDFRKLKTLAITGSKPRFRRDVRLGEHSESKRKIFAYLWDALKSFVNYAMSDRRHGLNSSTLEELRLSQITVTNACLRRIAAHHCRLKRLRLRELEKITNSGLLTVLRHEPLLEELHVSFCDSVSGKFLGPLKKLCPRLRRLGVSLCFRTSHSAVESFKLRRPTVKLS